MTLKEIIEEKVESARNDLRIIQHELEEYRFIITIKYEIKQNKLYDGKYFDLKEKRTKLIGNIEAYNDILALLESGKYE